MAITLSNEQVLWLRLHAQRLVPRQQATISEVADLVQTLCGIQAQDARAAALALRVRREGLIAGDVEQARIQDRTIIRTWGPRNTLHLLATEDVGWLLALLGPPFIASSKRRCAELGLDEDKCVKGVRIIRNALAKQGPLTRAEIVEQLANYGVAVEGQARPHLINRAALEGVLCLGPDRGTEPTYVLLSDWVKLGHPLSPEHALTKLVYQYLNAYGPATPEDMATWSGLPISMIRSAWQRCGEQCIEVELEGSHAWMLKAQVAWLDQMIAHTPFVCLLPAFDIYLLGYRNRSLAVPPQYVKRINAGGGMLHPTLLVDGRVVGTWKSQRKTQHLDVLVEPFEQLAAEVHVGLEAEIADLDRFLGMQARLHMMPYE